MVPRSAAGLPVRGERCDLLKLDFLKDAGGLLSTAGTMGLHLVSGTFVGFAMGWFLDKWLDTSPWLTMGFLLLGIVAGFMNVYRDAQQLMKEDQRERERGANARHDPKP